MTNEVIDRYYEILGNVRNELIERIEEIVTENIEIYDVSKEIDDEYYELPTFNVVNKYFQNETFSVIKINKDMSVIGNCWGEDGRNYTIDISELTTDTIYDIYIKLTKRN